MLQSGDRLTIHYPTTSHVSHFSRADRQPRMIRIVSVRDLRQMPLTAEEYLRRPYVRRSRWLIRAIEEDGRWRQFYLGNSAEFSAPSELRLGLFADGQSTPLDVLGRRFADHPAEMRALSQLILRWQDARLGSGVTLRVWADDLGIVG